MTENPESYGTPEIPPATPAPPTGAPPYPYAYPPGYGGPYAVPPQGPYPGAYPPPPMPYGAYPTGPAAPRNGLGIAALVTAIVAVVTSFTVFGGIALGVLAVILGVIAKGRVKRGEADNGGVALAGILLGVVAIVVSVAFVVFGVWVFKTVGGGDYVDCVQQAGQDQSKVDQCTEDFRQSVENRFSSQTTAPGR